MVASYSKLKRDRHVMPTFVKEVLQNRDLEVAYENRPAYQQNDYIGWINQAKTHETKIKRLNQMLDELKEGGVYMKMSHAPSAKK